MAFATYEDVEERWRELTADEQSRATVLLDDAETFLRGWVTVTEGDEGQQAALKLVSCNLVIRSMMASASSTFGVEQLSATMGPFGQTAHFANPSGDMYLTKGEKKMLGIGGGKGRILYPSVGGDLVDQLPDAL